MMRTWPVLLLVAACAKPLPPPPAPPSPPPPKTSIDLALATKYLGELDAATTADHGALWGRSLAGPFLFVDRATRDVVANRPDPKGGFVAAGKLFVGKWPSDETIANTSIEWHGVRWTMVEWDSVDEDDGTRARVRLLAHESFHREQTALDLFPPNMDLCVHLDEEEGRLTMQLEWNALEAALRASDDSARRAAIADALAFRARRRAEFDGAVKREVALEISEGLAEYTGERIAQFTTDNVVHAADERRKEGAAGFIRSFAYISGPLYGYLLDASGASWRPTVRKTSDLGDLLSTRWNVEPSKQPDASRYDGVALAAAEKDRAQKRAAQLAKWQKDLVDAPVLIVDLKTVKSGSFDPRRVYPFGDHKTVYASRKLIAEWGTLDVDSNSAILEDEATGEGHVTLGAQGWHIELATGWSMQPAARKGDMRVAPNR